MRRIFALGLLLLSQLATASTSVSIAFQGRTRRYLLHAPSSVAAKQPLPLVLVFHGGTDTPENMEEISGFSALADRERFMVVYPEGIGKYWNDGRGTTPPAKLGIDDLGFVRAVITDIRRKYDVDPKRIFAAGPSNGGIFAARLGCEMAGTFAAVAPVIAAIATNLATHCRPSAPVSVIGIQSVTDPLTPFGGGQEAGNMRVGKGGSVEGGRATQQLWARLDGCNANPATTALPVRVNDGTRVSRRAYSGCRGGTEVVWYEIEGGGHRWPPHQLGPAGESLARRTWAYRRRTSTRPMCCGSSSRSSEEVKDGT